MVNLATGLFSDIDLNVSFANIVDIDRIDIETISVVDSDSGSIYFVKFSNGEFSVVREISGAKRKTPDIIKVKALGGNLFVLTSNPSYLFKLDLKTFRPHFFVGNGTKTPADTNEIASNNSLYYPNDFYISEDIIYITEANNRILKIKDNDLSVFAGSLYSGNSSGVNACVSNSFSGLRGISMLDNKLLVSDSSNNRLVTVEKKDDLCNISSLPLVYNGLESSLNYPTSVFSLGDDYFVTDQNKNRILNFDRSGKVTKIIGVEMSYTYQGYGEDNNGRVLIGDAFFNTPTDICGQENNIFITDIFNGKIKHVSDDYVSSFLGDHQYILPLSCTIYDGAIYYVDSLTNKLRVRSAK